ncbi:hypothetical protein MPTK1_5g08480 [Marchantia polymorpha subsp. ruderalis]|uniref:Uncharacterized protein n=2 Tax=Marchantia polymorpha TaxID=3197 RepID=A0AAF6BG98_MARPO|nr:hypothetical protein MARPO_0086s0053 [Marchantia polymorpha]BBN11032.1 hypothetical protein Mp_5g08480 [Marchantia polymorpha subsp. ruderalis]|eukprot:PTQ33731.1 hypothetical protein MARPO_0086s0053 [Marchantia polymorpha]
MSADDVFVTFVESARRMLCESFETEQHRECDATAGRSQSHGPSWSWVCTRILTCCKAYPSGVTAAILLSELYESWLARERVERCVKGKGRPGPAHGVRRQKQMLGSKVTTIDSILERKFVPLEAVLDAVILDIQLLPGTNSYLLTLGDTWSFNSIEFYLHRKFYDLVDPTSGILRKGREIRLTGCRLRNALSAGSVPPRLLPTEYVIILLDEEQDEDLFLLGAQFCSDNFSSIQTSSIRAGLEYYFYARVDEIEATGVQGLQEQVKQQRLTLCDDNGVSLPLVLWNEQVSICSLLSQGSMVAIERPLIVYEQEGENNRAIGVWFEYGNRTRLYTVPYVPVAEQVTVEDTQPRMSSMTPNLLEHDLDWSRTETGQSASVSQVSVPRDPQGSLDFNFFPVRLLVENVRPKMTNVALYGMVTFLSPLPDLESVVKRNFAAYKSAYLLRIQDCSGALDIRLYFSDQWSAGEIHVGQIAFVGGIFTTVNSNGGMDCTWTEKQGGALVVNMTQLPALLSTACLHRIVPLSKISSSSLTVQVCRVQIKNLAQHGVQVKFCHIPCGHPVVGLPVPGRWSCNYCRRACETKETVLTFFSTALLVDVYPGHHTQAYASCSGRAAAEVLQISPDDFCSWSEIEQGMYLYSLENEEFLVTLYYGFQEEMNALQSAGGAGSATPAPCLKIGQAIKADPGRGDV